MNFKNLKRAIAKDLAITPQVIDNFFIAFKRVALENITDGIPLILPRLGKIEKIAKNQTNKYDINNQTVVNIAPKNTIKMRKFSAQQQILETNWLPSRVIKKVVTNPRNTISSTLVIETGIDIKYVELIIAKLIDYVISEAIYYRSINIPNLGTFKNQELVVNKYLNLPVLDAVVSPIDDKIFVVYSSLSSVIVSLDKSDIRRKIKEISLINQHSNLKFINEAIGFAFIGDLQDSYYNYLFKKLSDIKLPQITVSILPYQYEWSASLNRAMGVTVIDGIAKLATSTDLINWSLIDFDLNGAYGEIIWYEASNRFVYTSLLPRIIDDITGQIIKDFRFATSTDALNITEVNQAGTSPFIGGVLARNSAIVYSYSTFRGDAQHYTSSNGLDTVTHGDFPRKTIIAACWSQNLGLFVAYGRIVSQYYWFNSTDALIWNQQQATDNVDISVIIWQPISQKFIAFSRKTTSPVHYKSSDGITWQAITQELPNSQLNDIREAITFVPSKKAKIKINQ
jgi:hypothetical protein